MFSFISIAAGVVLAIRSLLSSSIITSFGAVHKLLSGKYPAGIPMVEIDWLSEISSPGTCSDYNELITRNRAIIDRFHEPWSIQNLLHTCPDNWYVNNAGSIPNSSAACLIVIRPCFNCSKISWFDGLLEYEEFLEMIKDIRKAKGLSISDIDVQKEASMSAK